MGDRFYRQQLDKLGTCPGYYGKPKRRNSRMAWDEDKKAQVIEMYESENPTPETSMEIVKQIADEVEESPNGVRMILTKAGVYVKKTPGASSSSSSSSSSRVSKAAAIEALEKALVDAGQEVDDAVVSKLTGKAAAYFTSVITSING